MPHNRKKQMRAEMRRILTNLDPRWEVVAHQEICHHLTSFVTDHSAGRLEKFLVWISSFHGEIDLSVFIAAMLRTKDVYLPRITGPGIMSFVRIDESWAANLEKGDRGVLEPREGYGEVLVPDGGAQIAVLVPGLAFDRSGRRLGRGGGFYDRFLARPDMAEAVRIGVCWSMQVVPEVPTDSYDMVMDWVCHERGILSPSS